MAEGWLRNLRIPIKRTRSPAPSTTFRQSVKLFCYTFFIHIVSIFLALSLLVPLPLLLDPFSSDLPLFVSNGLRFFSYSLYCLIGCIIFDGCATCLVGTPPRWNPFRILVTVLCGNQVFHAAELTAAKCWESIRLAECWFKLRGLQIQNTIPKIHFLSLLLLQRLIETLALISAKRDLYRRLAGRNYRTFLETVKEKKVILKIKNLTVEGLRPLVGLKRALSSVQLPSTSNRAQLGGQNRSGCRSTASHSQNERTRDQPQGHLPIEDLRPLVCLKHANAAKELDETLALISAKRNYRRTAKRNLYRRPAKRNYRTFLEYLRSLGLKHADAAKELAARNYRTFLETEAETGKENKENYVILKMAAKRWKPRRNNPGQNINIIISDFMKGFPEKRRLMNKKTYGIHWWPFQRSATGSPYGGHIQSLLKEEIVRETLKRKCRTMTVNSKWKDAVKNLGAKCICRQLVIHRLSSRKHIIRPHAIHQLPFQQNWATLKGYFLGDERPVDHSQNERTIDQTKGRKGKVKNSTIEDLRPLVGLERANVVNQPEGRKGKIKNLTIEDLRPLVGLEHADAVNQPECRKGEIKNLTIKDLRPLAGLKRADAAKQLDAMPICRPLVIHPLSSLELIIRPHVIHRLLFQQVTHLYFHFYQVTRADAAKQLDAMPICRPLVIHPLSSLELIIRPHVIHRLLFQQNWATLKWYFSKDERPIDLISLSMEEKLVSRLQLIHIRIGRCLPRSPALPPSGEIVEQPPALSSSQLPSTSNRTLLGGQDQSGSTASDSQNQRTRDRLEGRKGKIKNITIEYLRPYSVAGLKRAQVAKELGVSPATFKRHCRYLGIQEWPILPPKEVIRRPDHNREKNPSPTFHTLSNNEQITTKHEMGGQNLELNEHLQDSLEGPNFHSRGNGSIAEVENQNTIHDSHHGHCGDADVPFPDVYNGTEVAGGSGNILEQLFESCNFTFPILHPTPHPQIASIQFPRENMGSFEDHRNLLAPQKEPLPAGSSISDLALSQAMPITPIKSSEYWRDALASVEGHLMGSQSVPTNPHMTPLLTERQDSTLVKLNATHGEDTIKLRLPLTSGITELKQVVSTQLELGLDSFKVKYKDEYGEWILITRDEEVTEHLQLTLSGYQVSKLWVVNTTDSCCNCGCDKCGSLKGKRP